MQGKGSINNNMEPNFFVPSYNQTQGSPQFSNRQYPMQPQFAYHQQQQQVVSQMGNAQQTKVPTEKREIDKGQYASQEPTVLSNFIFHVNNFINTIYAAFDDCPKLRAKKFQFETAILPLKVAQEKFCEKYHEQMSPYYDACQNRNPAPFFEGKIKILNEMGFKEKYEELSDVGTYTPEQIKENTDNLWEYIIEMNKFASIYNHMPKGIVKHIEEIAFKYCEEFTEGGSFKLQNLDPRKIFKMGKEVLKGATHADMKEIIKNVPNLWATVGSDDGAQTILNSGKNALGSDASFADMLGLFKNGEGKEIDPTILDELQNGDSDMFDSLTGENEQVKEERDSVDSDATVSKRKTWKAPSLI